jgi:tetratricopeptide (TPR) repeat protein
MLLAGALVTAAGAQSPAPLTREQALAAIRKSDVEARRQAAAWLGELGTMADAPVLIAALRDADDVVRALAEHSVWQVWSRSGDPQVDALFQIGLEQMQRGAGPAAIETFGQIISHKPDFAEGWNKRATVYYLVGEYRKSAADCDEVLKRNPSHFGALSGYGMIWLRLDEPARALERFEQALAVNPNLDSVRETIDALRTLLIQQRRNAI